MGTVVIDKRSPVRLADRNPAKDTDPERFSPQTGQAIKMRHKLAGMV